MNRHIRMPGSASGDNFRNIFVHVTPGIQKVKDDRDFGGASPNAQIHALRDTGFFQLQKAEFKNEVRTRPAQTLDKRLHLFFCLGGAAAVRDNKDCFFMA